MAECPDSCEGRGVRGCGSGGNSLPVAEQIDLLRVKQQALQKVFVESARKKERGGVAEDEMRLAREEIEAIRAEMSRILDAIKWILEKECVEMRVKLGGTRNE
jgi:hypothetical protein